VRERLSAFARAAGAFVPDATTMAVGMLFALLLAASLAGGGPAVALDAFYRGLWMLLPFSMQVVLMLVLSSMLSSTPWFRQVIERAAGWPRTLNQVIVGTVLTTSALGYLYWGLAFTLGPVIAVQFARAAEARGLRVDFPLLLAAQFAASSVWQFGLSSPAPLLVATPGHFLEAKTGLMPLTTTIWSAPALCIVALFPIALAALTRLMMPANGEPLSAYPAALTFLQNDGSAAETQTSPARGFARWAETSRIPPALLAATFAGWLYHHFVTKQASLDLNAVITMLLIATLLLTRTFARFGSALQGALGTAAQVLLLYQLYGAIAGLLQFTSLGDHLANLFAQFATVGTFPTLIALAGTVVAIFVPSSGGLWVIQGFMTTETAAAVGVTPQLGLLSLGIGDQMGNLLSPFWMIVVTGMARVDFRTIFGYCLLFAGLWFALGVTVLSLVPIAVP
jgi:short-chain fatty acids transporter